MRNKVFNQSRALCLIAGNAIGTGIFTTTGFAIRDLGNPWLVLSLWILGGVYALLGVYSYSILHSRFPGSGGEYHFLRNGLHRYTGFPAGVATILIGFTAPLAAGAMGFSAYFLRAAPFNVHPQIIGLIALAVIYLLLVTSQQKGVKWHDAFIFIKLFLFAIMIAISFVVAKWSWPSLPTEFNIYTFAKSFFWIAYAYSGWNAVYYIANEVTSDSQMILKTSTSGTLLVIALYVSLNIPLLFGFDFERLSGAPEVVALFFEGSTGLSTEKTISAVIALGLLSTLSSFLLIVPSVYSKMADDNVLPRFFYSEPGAHPKKALTFQFILTSAFVLVFNFEIILNGAGFLMTVCSLLSVLTLYISHLKTLTHLQILGSSAYILLSSILVYLGGPWF